MWQSQRNLDRNVSFMCMLIFFMLAYFNKIRHGDLKIPVAGSVAFLVMATYCDSIKMPV